MTGTRGIVHAALATGSQIPFVHATGVVIGRANTFEPAVGGALEKASSGRIGHDDPPGTHMIPVARDRRTGRPLSCVHPVEN